MWNSAPTEMAQNQGDAQCSCHQPWVSPFHVEPLHVLRGGPFGPPLNQLELRRVYLTAVGMPLIWPALSFLYCAATAFLIDAGTLELHLP
jgi:hypothetical protein